MAFAKIKTYVQAFDRLVKSVVENTQKSDDEVRSWILGRKDDGNPLVAHVGYFNNFDYAGDVHFQACPAAAHIRKMNPRYADQRNHRVFRRGVLYNNHGDKGILFQCFQAKLETGFEHLFRYWGMSEHHPTVNSGQDAVLGSRPSPPLPPAVSLNPNCPPITIQSFTRVEAGDYFYFPSIPFFDRLEAPAVMT